ncbi:MAG: hypothetical protein ABJE47_12740 [bacterium]
MLYAGTTFSPGDTIECHLSTSLAMPDSIRAPWTGVATVQILRTKTTAGGRTTIDTSIAGVAVNVDRLAGDSLRVRLTGGATMDLLGRFNGAFDAAGTWTCDDPAPLASRIPGTARGMWYLSALRPID